MRISDWSSDVCSSDLLGPGVSDPVPERLALATEGYEPLVTNLRQMLRQGRLREADVIGEIADRALAMFDELAQHHQASVIADRLKDLRHFAGLLLEVGEVHRGLEHRNIFQLDIAKIVYSNIYIRNEG